MRLFGCCGASKGMQEQMRRELLERQKEKSVVRMQAIRRGCLARRHADELRAAQQKLQNDSATRIQAVWRGSSARGVVRVEQEREARLREDALRAQQAREAQNQAEARRANAQQRQLQDERRRDAAAELLRQALREQPQDQREAARPKAQANPSRSFFQGLVETGVKFFEVVAKAPEVLQTVADAIDEFSKLFPDPKPQRPGQSVVAAAPPARRRVPAPEQQQPVRPVAAAAPARRVLAPKKPRPVQPVSAAAPAAAPVPPETLSPVLVLPLGKTNLRDRMVAMAVGAHKGAGNPVTRAQLFLISENASRVVIKR